ncbi:reverse transcriptase [Cucumis melo var. makuwa]|uniref:Reverse transcriptase n=1 Tax=Cucumis melo var. makuwa TaxID=1194695 RepID=A0A5D3DSV6_CUCMM|nr:reverse transcriptase [Cucumis melo var. makuwa]TYK26673.1 reverse transcriptase [Cucumis melo var. makuwa]
MEEGKIVAIRDWAYRNQSRSYALSLAAFDGLKQAMMEGPFLGIADVTKPFEVETNASDYALGGVLLQNGHLIAYESSSFVVKTDNSATCQFFIQPKLTSKQARWQEFLAEFDFEFEHKKGSSNQAADALSWKHEHGTKCLLAHLRTSEIGGHPGWQRTYALLKKRYFWSNMRDDVMQYTKTCLIYQQDKVEKVKVAGLLNPLLVPTRPWKSVSMDFITHLPKTSSSTGRSPFEIVLGRQPFDHPYVEKNPQAHNFTKEWKQTDDIARAYLEKASRRMKKWADKKRRPLEFRVRDQILIKLRPEQIRIHEYLVKWKNLLVEETSWERIEDLEAWTQKIEEVKFRQLTGTPTVQVGENVRTYLSKVLFVYGRMPEYP